MLYARAETFTEAVASVASMVATPLMANSIILYINSEKLLVEDKESTDIQSDGT